MAERSEAQMLESSWGEAGWGARSQRWDEVRSHTDVCLVRRKGIFIPPGNEGQ